MSEGFEALLQGSQNLGDLVVLCSRTHTVWVLAWSPAQSSPTWARGAGVEERQLSASRPSWEGLVRPFFGGCM